MSDDCKIENLYRHILAKNTTILMKFCTLYIIIIATSQIFKSRYGGRTPCFLVWL